MTIRRFFENFLKVFKQSRAKPHRQRQRRHKYSEPTPGVQMKSAFFYDNEGASSSTQRIHKVLTICYNPVRP